MMGKTHKTIGIITGLAFSIYGVLSGNSLYTLALVTAPLGAMLPDIDHNSTINNTNWCKNEFLSGNEYFAIRISSRLFISFSSRLLNT